MSRADLRRLLHASSAAVALLGAVSPATLRLGTAYIAATAVLLEIVRLSVPAVRVLLARLVPVYRAHEDRRPSGAMWLAVGYALAAWWPAPAGVAGILAGALADPAGALVGSSAGVSGAKTVRGSAAVGITALAVMLALGYGPAVAAAAALVAAAAERWSRPLDDNLVLAPVVAGVVALLG